MAQQEWYAKEQKNHYIVFFRNKKTHVQYDVRIEINSLSKMGADAKLNLC
jgi:hypothetical protein